MHNKYYCALNVCIDDKVLSQLPEHGTLSQLRVIAVDSPATDGLVTSTTSTSTNSSAPTTSTSPDDTLPTTCNSATVNEPIDTTFLNRLFLQLCGQLQSKKPL